MINWQDNVHKPMLISADSGKPINGGETFFSVLHFENGNFIRSDFRQDEWEHVDKTKFLSWWRQILPATKDDKKQQILNAAVLLEIFNNIKESNSRHEQCFLYCLALLLMRLKKIRYIDLVHENSMDYIVLQDRSDKLYYRIRDPKMSPAEEALMSKNLESIFVYHSAAGDSSVANSENTDVKNTTAAVEADLA